MTLGPLTAEALGRFSRRLTKAIFYREVGERFEGVMYIRRHSVADGSQPELLRQIAQYAPMGVTPIRAGEQLSDQFGYRFNASSDLGVLYAVVEFGPQVIFQIIALSHRGFAGLNEYRAGLGQDPLVMDEEDIGLVF